MRTLMRWEVISRASPEPTNLLTFTMSITSNHRLEIPMQKAEDSKTMKDGDDEPDDW